jgi:hypothetical protein
MNVYVTSLALGLASAPLTSGTALAQHAEHSSEPQTITLDARGGGDEWFQNPHMVEFYALSVEMLRANRGAIDVTGYEQRSYAIFRAFAESMGADAGGMLDHLKAIPRQMVGIVADDATVLDSYENFLVALRGPK